MDAFPAASLNMSTDLFLDLFPAYLSLFIKVKRSRGYGPAVAARAVGAVRDWVSAETVSSLAGRGKAQLQRSGANHTLRLCEWIEGNA